MNAPDWQNRTALLFGDDRLDVLQKANILIVGVGGVGGMAAEMIARSGVSRMTIVDGDVVENSNRNRQIAALTSTAGMKKVDVFSVRLHDINPDLELTALPEFIQEERIPELLDSGNFDCVIDAIDSVTPKIRLLSECIRRGLKTVSSMGSGARKNPECVRCTDIEKTFNCTLARAVRRGLHAAGFCNGGCRAVFSTELPIKSAVKDNGFVENFKRSTTGTVSYMPAVFGCHCAAEAIRMICEYH